MLPLDTHIARLAQIELLNKKLVGSNLGRSNVSQVQELRCALCGGKHANERCLLEGTSEEDQFAKFQKKNPYSNTYNLGWKDHPNFCWSNNKNSNANQGIQQG